MATRGSSPVPHALSPSKFGAAASGDESVEGNERLTSSVAALLLVLLAIEGATVVRVGSLLTLHVFLGLLLIPPIALKIASALYRFVRFYSRSRQYRRKGPPPLFLRILGPGVVVLTIILFASGVVLLFCGPALRGEMLTIHQVSFVLWFGAMTIHVLGHILETLKLAPRDFARRTRKSVAGAGLRQCAIVVSLGVGVYLAVSLVGRTGHFLVG